MRYRRILLTLFLGTSGFCLSGQELRPIPPDLFEGERLKESKPVLVLLHTDWCAICRLQKREIRRSRQLEESIHHKTHFLEFNPEKYRKDLVFFGKEYTYVNNGTRGLHSLAIELSEKGEEHIYPRWVILSGGGEIIFKSSGLMRIEELEKIILLL